MSNCIKIESPSMYGSHSIQFTVSVLGQDKGYTVKKYLLPKGVPKGEGQGNS